VLLTLAVALSYSQSNPPNPAFEGLVCRCLKADQLHARSRRGDVGPPRSRSFPRTRL